MAAFNSLKLSPLFTLVFLVSNLGLCPATLSNAAVPPPCSRIECPSYDLIDSGKDYEIRRYSSVVLVSTSPITGQGFVEATRTGVIQLFGYIGGENNKTEKIEMAGPVVTQVSSTSNGEAASSYVVSFYIPKKYQGDPPAAEGLKTQKFDTLHAAVRQFPGFVSDSSVGDEVGKLIKSISGTKYSDAILIKTHGGEEDYIVGQYNAPFELFNRTNEIWLTFQ